MSGLLQTALAPGALRGRRALVFGASSGIGYASAQTLAGLGCELTLVARNSERLERAVQSIQRDAGVSVTSEPGDITEVGELQEILDRNLHTDILVTNCGGPPVGPFEKLSLDDWEQAWRSQLRSVAQSCRAIVPRMASRGWGRVVMIASITVIHPLRGFALSNAVRPGLVGLAATLSQEYAAHGVTANVVAPGVTRTERMESLLEQAAREGRSRTEALSEWTDGIPVSRMGEPEEIAAMVGFLASEAAAYLSGQTLVVDGGASRSG